MRRHSRTTPRARTGPASRGWMMSPTEGLQVPSTPESFLVHGMFHQYITASLEPVEGAQWRATQGGRSALATAAELLRLWKAAIGSTILVTVHLTAAREPVEPIFWQLKAGGDR